VSKYELKGKTAIITGGAGGLGTFMAMEYARAGANVVVASRNLEPLEKVAAEVKELGAESLAIAVDITKPDDVNAMVEQVVERFGSLDVLVNNAGAWGKSSLAEDSVYEEWVEIIDLNLTGTYNCCIAAGKQMIKQQSGKIINVSSTAGTKGNPGALHYSASKAGMISLSNNLSYMWAKHNICVNTILPGLIATQMLKDYNIIPSDTDKEGNPVPRLELCPDPEDVANLALFLASEASDSITGEQIPIRRWLKLDRFWQ